MASNAKSAFPKRGKGGRQTAAAVRGAAQPTLAAGEAEDSQELRPADPEKPWLFLNRAGVLVDKHGLPFARARRSPAGILWELPEFASKPRGRPFEKGQVANPLGRPKGRPDRRTAYRESIEKHLPELIERCIQMALYGDVQALRLCLDRVLPPVRPGGEPVAVDIPEQASPSERAEAIVRAALAGQLPPQAAGELLGLLADQARIREIDELARRVQALEQATGGQR